MTDDSSPISSYSQKNKSAWDELYRRTDGTVWGTDPIPFVGEYLDRCRPRFSDASRLLDAAGGEGRHLRLLLNGYPGNAHACDASPHALAKMREIEGDFVQEQCDLDATPFPGGHFDFIMLIDTVETLPNAADVLEEMYRILKPGGLLLCNIPGKEDEISSENMEETEDAQGDESYFYRGEYFYHFYEEADAIRLVEGAGFEVRENVIRHWEEAPHPGFREKRHWHTSRVFLLAKPEG